MNIAKTITAVVLSLLLAACGGKEEFSSHTGILPQSGAEVSTTRQTVVDGQGATTTKYVEINGELKSIEQVDESTTTAQDYGQTFLAGFTPGATAAVARKLTDPDCNGCGVDQTLVQVGTNVNNQVETNVGGGCVGPCKRPEAD